MSDKPLKNIPASIRQRLLNKAKADNRPFNELLHYYAMERFLYRLSMSQHSNRFVLKGALMLRVWRSPETRPTMDIDMLGMTSNSEIDIVAQFVDVLSEAIKQTFHHRGTELPEDIVAFSEGFATEKQVQWAAFRKRLRQEDVPVEFGVVASVVRDFLAPATMSLRSGASFVFKWNAPGPWVL